MPAAQSLLFVCMGNICRSPAAENVMRHILKRVGLSEKIRCDSAGTIGYHQGSPPDGRMQEAARARGISCSGKSRPVKSSDFKEFDIIFTMDQDNYRDVIDWAGSDENKAKVKPFCDFLSEHDDTFVPDPYYGGNDGFDYVITLLLDGCETILSEFCLDESAADKK